MSTLEVGQSKNFDTISDNRFLVVSSYDAGADSDLEMKRTFKASKWYLEQVSMTISSRDMLGYVRTSSELPFAQGAIHTLTKQGAKHACLLNCYC